MARAARAAEAQDPPVNDDVDNVPEVDDFRTGAVGEDDFIESLARKAGWVSKEEWPRDPAKHVDARAYLERLPDELETAKDRLRRTAQATETALEDVRRQERLRALEEIRSNAGDPEKVNAAVERVVANEGPPPQVQAWIRENTWFTEDPEAADYARVITNRLAAEGRPVPEQLAEARAAVMRRFPEHAGQAGRSEPTETRLSEVRPRPPVQAGSRGPASAPRERGWGDLPAAARTAAVPFVKAYRSRGLSEAEAQARYAGSYWRDQA